ncbi:hypothetical protein ACKC9G_02775, partial [Pokkaliibacter sp. CJK22405]|uniref:hypothetical protein n=1 Tax=Pokkaliibacter sp. CJK22405 TaxID=3384615 RepID=UPI0039846B65
SAVKRVCADGSVGFPHVRVGHCQASNTDTLIRNGQGVFLCVKKGLAKASQTPLIPYFLS